MELAAAFRSSMDPDMQGTFGLFHASTSSDVRVVLSQEEDVMILLRSSQRPHGSVALNRHPRGASTWKLVGSVLVLVCFALVVAACAPGSASTTSGATHQAPIHVPSGYQGLIEVVFTPTTTYDQALSILQSAGLQAEVPCSGPGPTVDPPVFSNQQATFAKTHMLFAAGTPKLTTSMLTQVASAPQVVSVGVVPKVACPD
jgi:hypothetical protein